MAGEDSVPRVLGEPTLKQRAHLRKLSQDLDKGGTRENIHVANSQCPHC